MIDIFNLPGPTPEEWEGIRAKMANNEPDGLELDDNDSETLGKIQDLVGILAPEGHRDPEAVAEVIGIILAEDSAVRDGNF